MQRRQSHKWDGNFRVRTAFHALIYLWVKHQGYFNMLAIKTFKKSQTLVLIYKQTNKQKTSKKKKNPAKRSYKRPENAT